MVITDGKFRKRYLPIPNRLLSIIEKREERKEKGGKGGKEKGKGGEKGGGRGTVVHKNIYVPELGKGEKGGEETRFIERQFALLE